jgi:RNA polymerase sigma factor (TIGR02999 family)
MEPKLARVYHGGVKAPRDVTQLLAELTGGNQAVVNALLPLIYDELHRMAENQLRRERKDHTLNTTALVHEAYLKLVDQSRVNWQNRAHFLGVASQAMRRILINYAEQRRAQKRGGDMVATTFNDDLIPREARADQLIDLDEALTRLKALSERQATVVECRFFGGLTHEEVAEVLGVSVPTVRRDWRLARAWLSNELAP